MNKIFIGTHKTWNITLEGKSKAEVARVMGAEVNDITFEEKSQSEYWLQYIPQEFRSVLSHMAYERGHSAGEEEVEMILQGLIKELQPAIVAFEHRITQKIIERYEY